ncbi:LDH2 family malate/lactate/ureidoglycolate dehydrogenase [Ancylobacter aquaticus]|uniref:LDH2 family malate/lactate/ureidoglycolate dehydrogenase n=1 Tax=Ancylobacter aquaticus TaxID=100 RepID=A0A4R1I3Y1_ANCAQ|nr:Ldh family oxidoreductase [Ancylobacter aquaticus]TCK28060.1 LDH2 family malate/lactate/ureidoglycolate dehydrogenase [Ancylobacter aquaticus]
MSAPPATISAAALQDFVFRSFLAFDMPREDAQAAAALMVEADLRGYDTHGVFRLRQYVNRLRGGGINPAARIERVRETAATALIDGGNGLGHLAMKAATELAIEKAAQAGIGWVGVRNSNHAGPAALYVLPQTRQGMIGLCAAVGSANHVAPFGGTDLLLGTNPLAIAVPAGRQPPFLLDMATTTAAMGKIKTLAQRGEQMPEGWMVGRDGRPLTDPNRRDEGFLLPIGGPKGYGLAMAIGLLAGALNGAAFGSNVVDFTADTTTTTNTGQFVAALSVSAFGAPETFAETVDAVFDEMRGSEPLPGYPPVRIPGEGRDAAAEQRRMSGLVLHTNLIKELQAIAGELSIPGPL